MGVLQYACVRTRQFSSKLDTQSSTLSLIIAVIPRPLLNPILRFGQMAGQEFRELEIKKLRAFRSEDCDVLKRRETSSST